MTYFVTLVGIDGAGKSTTAKNLVSHTAATLARRVGYVGSEYIAVAPETDLLKGPLAALGRPWSIRLALISRWLAKRVVHWKWLYPLFKVLHLVTQEWAARALARRYRLDIVWLDASALVSCVARKCNYASARETPEQIIRQLATAAPAATIHLWLRGLGWIIRTLRRLHIDLLPIPDGVVLLDLSATRALARLHARGERLDRHENLCDLDDARRDHLATVHALERIAGPRTLVVEVGDQTELETTETIAASVSSWLEGAALHESTTRYGAGSVRRGLKNALWGLLHPRYIASFFENLHRGAWREAFFVLSRPGRRLAREGYSAAIMNAIYRPSSNPGWPERVFLGYPLHAAVRGRLPRVQESFEQCLETAIAGRSSHEPIRILSAPSGTAEDILGVLERHFENAREHPHTGQNSESETPTHTPTRNVEIVFADLDPSGELEKQIRARADAIGTTIRFLRGDLTQDNLRNSIRAAGSFDIVLFVGLSAWLTKPHLIAHQALLAEVLRPGGLVISDCFTPGAFAQAGQSLGFHAHYYEPEVYRLGWRRAGLDLAHFPSRPGILSEPHRINHVLILEPRTASTPAKLPP